jgi:tryptophan halogenase
MIRSVLILGGGSAGFLTAIALKLHLPDLPVRLIHSSALGIIGVGEGTTMAFAHQLHHTLKVPLDDFYREAQPQWKLGIRFEWGRRRFFDYTFDAEMIARFNLLPRCTGHYCTHDTPWDYVGMASALMSHNALLPLDAQGRPTYNIGTAYHLENVTFVGFLQRNALRMGVQVTDARVVEVLQEEHGLTGLRLDDGTVATADLYVDASGFASQLLEQALGEPWVSYRSTLFNDSAIAGGWDRREEPIKPYTTATAMQCGWCWQIDHEHRINRGYVYSSAFLSQDKAIAEFLQANPRVTDLKPIRFRAGRLERAWVKNVVGIGNSTGFVEPLESTALSLLMSEAILLAQALQECDGDVPPAAIAAYNRHHRRLYDDIRWFLGVHFKFNERYDNEYWRCCRAKTDLGPREEVIQLYREVGPNLLFRALTLSAEDQFGAEGYLALLVGMEVPYRRTYHPTPADLQNWQRAQQWVRQRAMQALTVPQVLAMMRQPGWSWPKEALRMSDAGRQVR